MGIGEKEGGLPVFNTDIQTLFFFPTAEIIARLTCKIGANLPAAQGLMTGVVIHLPAASALTKHQNYCFYSSTNERLLKKVMNAKVDGRSVRGRPRCGWMDGVKRTLSDRRMDMR